MKISKLVEYTVPELIKLCVECQGKGYNWITTENPHESYYSSTTVKYCQRCNYQGFIIKKEIE